MRVTTGASVLIALLSAAPAWATRYFNNYRVSDTTTGDRRSPSMALDDNDRVYIAWTDTRDGTSDIYFSTSADGTSWASNTRVNDSFAGDQDSPFVLAPANDTVYVAWADNRNGDYDIYFSKSTDAGQSWLPAVQVDDATTGDALTPAIAEYQGWSVYAAWTDYRSGILDPYIAFASSADGGETWNASVRVDDATVPSVQERPWIAVDSLGAVYVIWQDERNGAETDFYFARSTDGGQTWGLNLLVDDAAIPLRKPLLDVSPTGIIYAGGHGEISSQDTAFYTTSSIDGGVTWTPDGVVDNEWTNKHRLNQNASGALRGEYEIHMAFEVDAFGDLDVFYSLSTDGGITWQTSEDVNDDGRESGNDQLDPWLALSNSGRPLVAFTDYRNGYPAIFVGIRPFSSTTAVGDTRWLDWSGDPLAAENTRVSGVAPRTPLRLRVGVLATNAWGLTPRTQHPFAEELASAAVVDGGPVDLSVDDGSTEDIGEGLVSGDASFPATDSSVGAAGAVVSGTLTDTHTIDGTGHVLQETDRSGPGHKGPGDLEYIYSFVGLTTGARQFSLRASKSQGADASEGFSVRWSADPAGPFVDFEPPVLVTELIAMQFDASIADDTSADLFIQILDTNPMEEDNNDDAISIDAMAISVTQGDYYALGSEPDFHRWTFNDLPLGMGEYTVRLVGNTTGEPFAVGWSSDDLTELPPAWAIADIDPTEYLFDLRASGFSGGAVGVILQDALRAQAGDFDTADTASIDLLELSASTGIALEMAVDSTFTDPVQITASQMWDDPDHSSGASLGTPVLAATNRPQVRIDSRPHPTDQQVDMNQDQYGEWELTVLAPSPLVRFAGNYRTDDGPTGSDQLDPVLIASPDIVAMAWEDTRAGDSEIFVSTSTDAIVWGPSVAADPGAGPQHTPDLSFTDTGALLLVWTDERTGDDQILFARSDDDGATWSASTRVDDGADAGSPGLALDASGRIHVVWRDGRSGDDDIYTARSDDGGTTWNPGVRVDDDTGTSAQTHPSILSTAQGLWIAWQDARAVGSGEIYMANSGNQGATWGASSRVDFGRLGRRALAADGAGRLFVTFEDDRDGTPRVYVSRSTNGSTWALAVAVGPSGRGDQSGASVVATHSGQLFLAWQDSRDGTHDIYLSRSTDGGATWTRPGRVDNARDDPSDQSRPTVGLGGADWVFVGWQDHRSGTSDAYVGVGRVIRTFYLRPVVTDSAGDTTYPIPIQPAVIDVQDGCWEPAASATDGNNSIAGGAICNLIHAVERVGELAPADDEIDVWRVALASTSSVDVTLHDSTGTFVLELLDAVGAVLDSQTGTTPGETLNVAGTDLPVGGYFVRVSGTSGGRYSLTVQCLTPGACGGAAVCGAGCDDNNACNGVEICDPIDGCVSGTAPECDDGNPCNGVESCEPTLGCVAGVNTDAGHPCPDSNPCDGAEVCDGAGSCTQGFPLDCDDGDVCNGAETCDPSFGCRSGAPAPSGTSCSDGEPCNGEELCDGDGICVPGEPPPSCDRMEKVSGDHLRGTVQRVLDRPFVVRVIDGNGDPVGGVPIDWRVVTGGGDVAPASTFTDAEGLAEAIGVAGPTPGVNNNAWTATNSSLANPVVTFSASAFNLPTAATAPPVAVAIAVPETGPAPLEVTLDGSQSHSDDGAILEYVWDPADGSLIQTPLPVTTHVLDTSGGYMVRLEVVDAFGQTATDSVWVGAMLEGRMPPVASIVADALVGENHLAVSFTCECSDADGEIVTTMWDYGDGDSSDLRNPTHAFVSPGSYRVHLTVEDDDGLLGRDSVLVTVSDRGRWPPVARALATPLSGDAPLTVHLEAAGYDVDGSVIATRWLRPDGQTSQSDHLTLTLAEVGYHPVLLEVEDDDGLVGRDQITLVVTNEGLRPPRIVSRPETSAQVGVPYSYDTDGLPTAQGNRPLFWFLGRVIDTELLNSPAGMTIDERTGLHTWTPSPEQVGPNPVTIHVSNEAGLHLQDFEIVVEGGTVATTDDGCGCRSAGAGCWLSLALLVFALRRRRRHRHHPWSAKNPTPRVTSSR